MKKNKFENLTSGKFSAIEKEKMNAMMGGTRAPQQAPMTYTFTNSTGEVTKDGEDPL